MPEGYNFDFLNAGAVPKVLSVKGGNITEKTGMSYRILALDASTHSYTTQAFYRADSPLLSSGFSEPMQMLGLTID